MGAFYVVTLLLLFVQAKGKAFDPCNCEDLDGPDLETVDDFLHDELAIDTSAGKSRVPPTTFSSVSQSGLIQKAENSIKSRDSDSEISTEIHPDDRTVASVRRSEREIAKDDSVASANKTAPLEADDLKTSTPLASPTGEIAKNDSVVSANKTATLEVANLETSTPLASPTGEISGNTPSKTSANSANNTHTGNDSNDPEMPNDRISSSDNLERDGGTSKNDTTGDETSSSTAKPQCGEHYIWDDTFKRCFYDPRNVPVAKYDEYGNIDANAGNMQQIVTTESPPTTVPDCPQHQKWDKNLKACYYEPNLQDPAVTDYFGDVIANAG